MGMTGDYQVAIEEGATMVESEPVFLVPDYMVLPSNRSMKEDWERVK